MISFAERVADAGFSVAMPLMFGTPGKPVSTPYILGELIKVCISREFRLLAARQSSPITNWLRALCRNFHSELGGKGVGAIGMCLTGNFALALMVDDAVMAPVLSQPSLPFPFGKERAPDFISPTKILPSPRIAMSRCWACDSPTTQPARASGSSDLRAEFDGRFEGIEIDSSKGNAFGIPQDAHSVLTLHLVDQEGHPTRAALDRVLEFFRERLS